MFLLLDLSLQRRSKWGSRDESADTASFFADDVLVFVTGNLACFILKHIKSKHWIKLLQKQTFPPFMIELQTCHITDSQSWNTISLVDSVYKIRHNFEGKMKWSVLTEASNHDT